MPGLPIKKKALDKVHKQTAGVSARVDFWWQVVRQDVQHQSISRTPSSICGTPPLRRMRRRASCLPVTK